MSSFVFVVTDAVNPGRILLKTHRQSTQHALCLTRCGKLGQMDVSAYFENKMKKSAQVVGLLESEPVSLVIMKVDSLDLWIAKVMLNASIVVE